MRSPLWSSFSLVLLVVLCLVLCRPGHAQQYPLFGEAPKPGKVWVLHKHGAEIGETFTRSWIVFSNSASGDILAFEANRWPGSTPAATNSPMRDSALSKFLGGYPWRMEADSPSPRLGWSNVDTIRFQDAKENVAVTPLGKDALEYTFVYEHESKKLPARLAHGYVVAAGEFVFYVQHTSTHAITSELAHGMAEALFQRHSQK